MKDRIIFYTVIAVVFSVGVIFGNLMAVPGKSESHYILQRHGAIEADNGKYLLYLPDNNDLSVEEFEALAVISTLYEHVEVLYTDN